MTDRRLVITGTGLATIFGVGRNLTWRSIAEGRCGLTPTSSLTPDDDETAQGHPCIEASTLRAVAREAIEEARLGSEPGRIGVIMGTTLHGIRAVGRYLRTGDVTRLAEVPSTRVLRDACDGLGVDGPRITTCSACSSGLASVALGATMIRAGMLDVAIVGGYDPTAEYAAAGFSSLRLVSPGPVRPFCRDREGLRLGPGYAALVLERASHAAARGTPALAELLGAAEAADAFHLTRPEPHGRGAARAMEEALRQAGLRPDEIDVFCAHATGTPANDAAEFEAMRAVFGDTLASMPVIACKSHIGHTLGAAGAVELVLALTAMREGILPPVPYVTPEDLEFQALDLVLGTSRRTHVRTTMNLSIGFGGANACVVLGKRSNPAPQRDTPEWEVAITGIGMIVPGAPGNDHVLERLKGDDDAPAGPVPPTSLDPILREFRLRRESEYTRLTIAAVSLALAHAGVDDVRTFTPACGAILGTSHGSANYSEAYYRELVERGLEAGNPMLFAEGVPNAAAAQLSVAFGITCGCQTIFGSRTAGLEALALAAARVRSGEWRRAIISAAEEHNDAVNAAYLACGLTGGDTSFVAAGGAGAFVLERSEDAVARGAYALATFCQSGLAFARQSGALAFKSAIDEALSHAGAGATVIGSDNGTWIDDVERAVTERRCAKGRYAGMRERLAEMFAAGPLVRLGAAILQARPGDELTALCVDPGGPVAAASVRVM